MLPRGWPRGWAGVCGALQWNTQENRMHFRGSQTPSPSSLPGPLLLLPVKNIIFVMLFSNSQRSRRKAVREGPEGEEYKGTALPRVQGGSMVLGRPRPSVSWHHLHCSCCSLMTPTVCFTSLRLSL